MNKITKKKLFAIFINVINSAQQKKDKNTYDLKARRMVFSFHFNI